MKIYIDHFPDEDEFVRQISRRIEHIHPDIHVLTYAELRYEGSSEEGVDAKTMKESDIVIPVITPNYLAKNGDEADNILTELSLNSNKTIFPLLYGPANWSSKTWIVKSKVFPSNGNYQALSQIKQEETISDLIKTIGNIFNQKREKPSEYSPTIDSPQTAANRIFISHSHSDADFAELLKLKLQANEIDCWIDSERLKIGQDWREGIDQGIATSSAVIVIMSPEARKSEYVTYEWAYAWGKGIRIFPLMLEQTPLHPRLESLQYLDFTNRITRPFEELIDRIKQILNH
ncbi:MAG: toll/interleukin-1 receptor domain-containing protein [Crocinitomicaceae bacterium]